MRRPRANANNGLLRVKKTVLEDPINVLVNATQFGAITYELSDLPQASNYINLYEEFRIDRIVVSQSLNKSKQHGSVSRI